MPDLNALYKQDAPTQGLVVLGIDTDESSRADAEQFVRDNGLAFTILWDEGTRVSSQYRLSGYPASFFIDRAGVIRSTVSGAIRRDDMNERAKQIY